MPARALCVALLICSSLRLAAQQKDAPSGVVQVAVHYGPQRDLLLSGVVVGDGRRVLTEAKALEAASEIAIAFTDGELFDVEVPRHNPKAEIGVLDLPKPHGQPVAPSPPDVTLMGETNALAGGAPESFKSVRVPVRLRPIRDSRGQPRWLVVPALDPHFRGGPLLDAQDRLLGLLIQEHEGHEITGVPLTLFAELMGTRSMGTRSPAEPIPMVPSLWLPLPVPATGWTWKGAAAPAVSQPTRAAAPAVSRPVEAAPETLAAPEARKPAPAFTPVGPTLSSLKAEQLPVSPSVPAGDTAARRIHESNLQIQRGEYAGAVATLEEALKLYPDRPEFHYHLALAYWHQALHRPDGRPRGSMEKGSYRKAIQEFELFLAQASGDPRASDAQLRLELLRRAQFGYRPKTR